ncbi:hypothetical protein KTU01_07280 [Kocuria turfanensis]|uniref:Uncharacterized protein n=1 Tax=Kocuria turfanensis TaxID=388357 RepID=A0A512IA74_9MICC|nr:hypothetical protein KTU01_07280 [Kocuria turfanensis]
MITTGGKPHSSWYSGYSGLGALEAAMSTTSTDACTQKATEAGSPRRRRDGAADTEGMQAFHGRRAAWDTRERQGFARSSG